MEDAMLNIRSFLTPAGLPMQLPPIRQGDLPIVSIAASVGGIEAVSIVLASLPATFPGAILLVLHLSASAGGLLAPILAKRTRMRVVEARGGVALRVGTVYTAPPSRHLLIGPELRVLLSDSPPVHHSRPSADPLFESAAAQCGSLAIGVVLTGRDSDGSAGSLAIRAAGGTVIAQDPESAECPEMPLHAIQTGAVDFVLRLEEMGAMLERLVMAQVAT
jgi:two-component system chemotaxis response regulator CheB